MPSSARTGAVHASSRSIAARAGYSSRALEVDQAAVEPVADRPPHVLLDQPRRRILERHALVDVAHRLGDAGDHQRGERLGLLRGRLRVADAHLDGAEAEVRPHRPPHLRELDDRAGRAAGTRCTRGRPPSRRRRRGSPQRGKLLVKLCVRAECRPLSRPSRYGELAEIASSSGSTGRSRSQTRTARSMSWTPTCTCRLKVLLRQATYLRPVLDAAVVLGVDDRLLAVVGPRVGAGRAERDARGAPASANSRRAALALARERVVQVGADARDDLDLRGDQLAGDRLAQDRVARPRPRAAPRSAAPVRACRGRGSRTPPRRPTVKSVDAANVSSARSRSTLFIA